MGNESGTWIMHGLPASDPNCIRTAEQLADYIDAVGFLPLFQNRIPGFSVEEHTQSAFWWSGDETRDPWEWRAILAAGDRVAYGKFFWKKAGFISKAWLPYFINARRDGYDFDARWDDEKASFRQKRIMDLFADDRELFSYEVKALAGFGKDGEKNFEGVMTELQTELYLCVREFRRRLNKRGEPYGWAIAVYTRPENLWGSDYAASAYGEAPELSRARIREQMRKLYPGVSEKLLTGL